MMCFRNKKLHKFCTFHTVRIPAKRYLVNIWINGRNSSVFAVMVWYLTTKDFDNLYNALLIIETSNS